MSDFFASMQGTLFGMFDMFAGGGLSNLSIFALGIMPYISASIIIQLLTVVSPELKRLKEEGASGRKKITQYTRYGTVMIAAVQGLGIAIGIENMTSPGGAAVVMDPGWAFRLTTIITLVSGTVL
jgi:preprotein translocase subunit SecY